LGYFVSATDTLTLPSNADFNVTVKRRIKGGDHSDAMRLALEAADSSIPSRMQTFGRSLLGVAIISWNLTDENEQPVPVSDQAIGELERVDYEFLSAEVGKRAALRTEEAEAPFVSGSGSTSKATKSRRRSS
jgi:hypothetical protein